MQTVQIFDCFAAIFRELRIFRIHFRGFSCIFLQLSVISLDEIQQISRAIFSYLAVGYNFKKALLYHHIGYISGL